MNNTLRQSKAELEFLSLAYNRFYDIFEEAMNEIFWKKDEWYRDSKIKDGFSVYVEILHSEPIKFVLEQIKKSTSDEIRNWK